MAECAWGASRTKNTFLSSKYSKTAARRGKKRAIVAVGHAILRIVYHMLKQGVSYRELGANFEDDKRHQARIHYHKKILQELGVDIPETISV